MPHDERGREIPDPTPLEWPLHVKRPLSIQDEIKRFIRIEASQAAQDAGEETFEEADDFDVGDDPDLMGKTEYELDDEQMEGPAPFLKNVSGGNQDVPGSPPGEGGAPQAPTPPTSVQTQPRPGNEAGAPPQGATPPQNPTKNQGGHASA